MSISGFDSMASTIEEVSIIILVLITAIYVVLTGFILFESWKQRIQNKESTRQILGESKSQRDQDKHSTMQILKESRLQRLQDAELLTMPRSINIFVLPDELKAEFIISYPIRDVNFTESSKTKPIPLEITGSWSGSIYPNTEAYYYIGLDKLNLKEHETGKPFILNITVKFRSFLGHDFKYKFKSENLFMDKGERLNGDFTLIEVKPPWD